MLYSAVSMSEENGHFCVTNTDAHDDPFSLSASIVTTGRRAVSRLSPIIKCEVLEGQVLSCPDGKVVQRVRKSEGRGEADGSAAVGRQPRCFTDSGFADGDGAAQTPSKKIRGWNNRHMRRPSPHPHSGIWEDSSRGQNWHQTGNQRHHTPSTVVQSNPRKMQYLSQGLAPKKPSNYRTSADQGLTPTNHSVHPSPRNMQFVSDQETVVRKMSPSSLGGHDDDSSSACRNRREDQRAYNYGADQRRVHLLQRRYSSVSVSSGSYRDYADSEDSHRKVTRCVSTSSSRCEEAFFNRRTNNVHCMERGCEPYDHVERHLSQQSCGKLRERSPYTSSATTSRRRGAPEEFPRDAGFQMACTCRCECGVSRAEAMDMRMTRQNSGDQTDSGVGSYHPASLSTSLRPELSSGQRHNRCSQSSSPARTSSEAHKEGDLVEGHSVHSAAPTMQHNSLRPHAAFRSAGPVRKDSSWRSTPKGRTRQDSPGHQVAVIPRPHCRRSTPRAREHEQGHSDYVSTPDGKRSTFSSRTYVVTSAVDRVGQHHHDVYITHTPVNGEGVRMAEEEDTTNYSPPPINADTEEIRMERTRLWIYNQFGFSTALALCTCHCVPDKVSRHLFLLGTSCAFCDEDSLDLPRPSS